MSDTVLQKLDVEVEELLFDRGYSDHRLFKAIVERGGAFVTRLKASSVPVVTAIRCGLGQAHIGRALTGEFPYRGVVWISTRGFGL